MPGEILSPADHPPRTPPSQRSVYSTPKTNISRGSYVSQGAKDKLARLAPDGQRCLITLDIEPLHCCHVVARATEHRIVHQLEYAWGVTAGELHLHTTRNMIYLRAEMHSRFDRQDWALVPTLPVLYEIAAKYFAQEPGSTPLLYTESFPDQEWEYYFVPFRCSPMAFLRFERYSASFTTHTYPYASFGSVKSHVHPYFVICNAAEKEKYHRSQAGYLARSSSDPDVPPSRSTYKDGLQICVRLYETWTSTPAPPLLEPPPDTRSSTSATPSRRSNPTSHPSRASQHGFEQPRHGDESCDAQYSSDLGNGNSCKRARVVSAWTRANSLPTPEQSQNSRNDRKRPVEAAAPKDYYPMHYWTSVSSWVEDVEASSPCKDPYTSNGATAKQCLARYALEEARCPPSGLWEKWVPEYELT
ncbi:hypothetical protein BDV93DRAFT_529816 [Ceratobasidium sp. AG-I]|nr:hypothetical protein BDV93DRAFT_529816 [Ceratobasidium sp. AG-I]